MALLPESLWAELTKVVKEQTERSIILQEHFYGKSEPVQPELPFRWSDDAQTEEE